jgi:GNAT superfamily N-acetyltransferase/AcrR family transcriptional regulator
MTIDPERRERVLDAAAEVYTERSIANAGKREIAARANVPVRTVTAVGEHRIDLLRQVVERLPFPPVAERIALQAAQPMEPAIQALLRAAREILGDPATAWDPLELQALSVAPYDDETQAVVRARLDQRWEAARAVVRQLRGSEAEASVDDDAATLHLMSVGLGLALLAPLSRRWSDPRSWTALTARLLEAVSAPDVDTIPVGAEATWRARVAVPDSPSVMARMARVMSMIGVNVDTLFTEPASEGRQIVHAIFRSSPQVARESVVAALESVGSDVIVVRGTMFDTNDIATRVLQLSARVAADPSLAPRAAADLVLADSWEVLPASTGPDASPLVLRLQWTLDHHVVLRRTVAPFTPDEQRRASALLDLVAAVAEARGDEQFGWREFLPDGSTVIVRLARPEDATGVEEMHDRSSSHTRYQRYFTPMNEWREENLRRISGEHRGATLVVTDPADRVIALGNVFPAGPDDTSEAEVALIVEDDWQGRRLGRVLLGHLIDVARRLGFTTLVAYVLAENRGMLRLLDGTGLDWQTTSGHDLGPSVVRRMATLA